MGGPSVRASSRRGRQRGRVPGGVHAGRRRRARAPPGGRGLPTTPRNVEWARLLQRRSIFPVARDVSGPAHRGFRRGGIGAPARGTGAADQDRPAAARHAHRARDGGRAARLPVGEIRHEPGASAHRPAARLSRRVRLHACGARHRGTGRGLVRQRVRCRPSCRWGGWRARRRSMAGSWTMCRSSPLAAFEAAGERTLVPATRRYKALPDMPNRVYVQPSQPIRVNKFAVTDGEGIRVAYRLGLADGRRSRRACADRPAIRRWTRRRGRRAAPARSRGAGPVSTAMATAPAARAAWRSCVLSPTSATSAGVTPSFPRRPGPCRARACRRGRCHSRR